jgi:hypothetical protein
MKENIDKINSIILVALFNGIACFPGICIQNIKVQKQKPGSTESLTEACRTLYKDDGVKRFFRGLSPFSQRVVGTGILGSAGLALGFDFAKSHDVGELPKVFIAGTSAAAAGSLTIVKESKELIKTKKLSEPDRATFIKNTSQILPLVFSRFLFPWVATAFAKSYADNHDFSNTERNALSFTSGIASGMASTPIDTVLTQVYGSGKTISETASNHFKARGVKGFFAGAALRGLQTSLWVGTTAAGFKMSENWADNAKSNRARENRH